jgi:hypothetical protein
MKKALKNAEIIVIFRARDTWVGGLTRVFLPLLYKDLEKILSNEKESVFCFKNKNVEITGISDSQLSDFFQSFLIKKAKKVKTTTQKLKLELFYAMNKFLVLGCSFYFLLLSSKFLSNNDKEIRMIN